MTASPDRNGNRATIVASTVEMPVARLGPPNPMPKFSWQQPFPDRPTPPNRGLSADESRHGFSWGKDSILPYQVFDNYDRNQTPQVLPIISMDNGRLGLTIAPQFGGRLLSLRDHDRGRDLVFANPVFQPGNLGLLNAWFSGGIEWNGLVPGHTPVACAPVFVATLETDRGPILRLYEFDRVLEVAWQIDLFIPDGDDRLFVHGRIINPDPADKLGYWWTNTAVAASPGMRVVSPADYGIEHVLPGNQLERFAFPDPTRFDGSYPDNWVDAVSVFFRAPDAPRLWLAALDQGGVGLAQTATGAMWGRKFFYFGTSPGGQHWMDFLSQPGKGDYIEIQSGLAPTQNQKFALPGNTEMHWTECYGALSVDAGKAHSADYQVAVAATGDAIDRRFPTEELATMDMFLRQMSVRPTGQRLAIGSPWGGRDERLTGRPIAAGLDFLIPDARPSAWDDLIDAGRFSPASLGAVPADFVVSPRWCTAILNSTRTHGETWLNSLMLGLAALNDGRKADASDLFEQSLAMKRTWLGYRQRALVAPSQDMAERAYMQAWGLPGAPPELADEIVDFFRQSGRISALTAFLADLPAVVRGRERVILARAQVAAQAGEVEMLAEFLTTQFATIREGETLLDDLWRELQRNIVRRALGRDPTAAELAHRLSQFPLPQDLNFQMHTARPAPQYDNNQQRKA